MAIELDELEPRKKKPAVRDLTPFSVDELEEYIASLQAEIERARAAIASKKAFRSGAEAFFKR